MNRKKMWGIIISLIIVFGFISYIISYEVASEMNKPFPMREVFGVDPRTVGENFSYDPGTSNYTITARSGSDSSSFYFLFPGGLYDMSNLTLPRWFLGITYSDMYADVTYDNVSLPNTDSGFSFFVTNFSLNFDTPFIVTPLSVSGYFPNGMTYTNGKLVTESSGYQLGSPSITFYNFTGLYGVHHYWLNFTINPFVYSGPYRTYWNALPISIMFTVDILL